MFKFAMGVIRFVVFGWWFIPIIWVLVVILTNKITEANEFACDFFYGEA